MPVTEKKIIKDCSDYGIINLRKLEKIDDYKLVIKIINENPISVEEYILKLYQEGKHSDLFQYAVDNDLGHIKGFYIAQNHPNASCKTIEKAMQYGIRMDHKYKKLCNFFYATMNILLQNVNVPNYPQSMVEKIKIFKKEFCESLLRKHSHLQQIQEILKRGGIKKIDLEKMLEERDFRHLAIDLCSAIELVLNKKYQLSGGAQEIFENYIKGICQNEEVKPLLTKLRKYRNKCVHSNIDLDYEEPTYVEFKYLIEYVCNFGYGEEDYE